MAGEMGADKKGLVARLESGGRPVTPEDVWNAAVRAGADPARMALSLCHVLGEVSLAESDAGEEDGPVAVRYTLKNGRAVAYDASRHNPFKDLGDSGPRFFAPRRNLGCLPRRVGGRLCLTPARPAVSVTGIFPRGLIFCPAGPARAEDTGERRQRGSPVIARR